MSMNKYLGYSNCGYFIKQAECHKVTEIAPHFFIGSLQQFEDTILTHSRIIDTAVALDHISPDIWSSINPEDLEIVYFPVKDYGIAKTSHIRWLVDKIIAELNEEKNVFLFCLGGHGRTGYIAACVLAALGYKDPIGHIKTMYCSNAIETLQQIESIADFMLHSGFNPISAYEWYDKIEEAEKEYMKKFMYMRQSQKQKHKKSK